MRTIFLGAMSALCLASAAQAEVIEIADDGEARVVGTSAGVAGVGMAPLDVQGLPESSDPFDVAAKRHGIDVTLLKAVAWTESRGRNDAVSPKGARGIMQLMPATAASLGVDPRDPIANINGGAAYLARQLATFRDVPLALAAYNAGPGAVMRYRGVPPYAETRDYVAKIMRRWSPAGAQAGAGRQPFRSASKEGVSDPPAPAIEQPLPFLMIEVPEA